MKATIKITAKNKPQLLAFLRSVVAEIEDWDGLLEMTLTTKDKTVAVRIEMDPIIKKKDMKPTVDPSKCNCEYVMKRGVFRCKHCNGTIGEWMHSK